MYFGIYPSLKRQHYGYCKYACEQQGHQRSDGQRKLKTRPDAKGAHQESYQRRNYEHALYIKAELASYGCRRHQQYEYQEAAHNVEAERHG